MTKGRGRRGNRDSDTISSNSSSDTELDDDVLLTQKLQGNVNKCGCGVNGNVGKRGGVRKTAQYMRQNVKEERRLILSRAVTPNQLMMTLVMNENLILMWLKQSHKRSKIKGLLGRVCPWTWNHQSLGKRKK